MVPTAETTTDDVFRVVKVVRLVVFCLTYRIVVGENVAEGVENSVFPPSKDDIVLVTRFVRLMVKLCVKSEFVPLLVIRFVRLRETLCVKSEVDALLVIRFV